MTWGVVSTENKQNEKKVNSISGQVQPAPFRQSVTEGVVYHHYAANTAFAVGITLVICGLLSMVFGIAQEVLLAKMHHSAHGVPIGSGVFFLITGILGIVSSKRKKRGIIIASSVFSFLAFIGAVLMLAGLVCVAVRAHRKWHGGPHPMGRDAIIPDHDDHHPPDWRRKFRKPEWRKNSQPDQRKKFHSEDGDSSEEHPKKMKDFERRDKHHKRSVRSAFHGGRMHGDWKPIFLLVSGIVFGVQVLLAFILSIVLFVVGVRALRTRPTVRDEKTAVVPFVPEKGFAGVNDLPATIKFDDRCA